jgi:hypothetical protein
MDMGGCRYSQRMIGKDVASVVDLARATSRIFLPKQSRCDTRPQARGVVSQGRGPQCYKPVTHQRNRK